MPTRDEWTRLTALPEKQDAYALDLYFRECWSDLCAVMGNSVAESLGPLAMLSFKPDAIVGRRMRVTLDFVADHGFIPIAFAPIRLNRHSMRELWRYNWDIYTVDRLAMSTLLYGSLKTIVVVLRDSQYQGKVPGSLRLADLKGPSAPEDRTERHLRALLHPPNRILNFVHVADEPADIVREAGIFLDRAERRALFSEVKTNLAGRLHDELTVAVAGLEAACPPHDLDFDRSVSRLERAGIITSRQAHQLQRKRIDETRLSFERLCAVVDPADPHVPLWDFICVAIGVLPEERVGLPDLLPPTSLSTWRAEIEERR